MYNNKINAHGYEKYKEQHVLQASPQELVVMVYDCCLKNLKLAKLSIEAKELEKSNLELQKAQDCINELIMGLDFNFEISKSLMSIYDFAINFIIDINLNKTSEKIPEIVSIIQELRDAWAEASKLSRKAQFSGGEA